MNTIWFSEIRWDYLRTRKQHLLSYFPNGDSILFIQPLSLSNRKYSTYRIKALETSINEIAI